MYQDFYPNTPPRRELSQEEMTKIGWHFRQRERLTDACLLLCIVIPVVGIYFRLLS